MNITFMLYILIIILMITICRIVFSIILSMNESRMQKIRNQQLNITNKKKIEKKDNTDTIKHLVKKVTTPAISHIIKSKRPKNEYKLQRKLIVAGWDKYLTPIQWIVIRTFLQIMGVILFILMKQQSTIFASIFLLFFAFLPQFLINNSYNNRSEALLISFPETVNIISGYLSAGLLLPRAVEETAKNASPEWKELLTEFVAKSNTTDIMTALDWLKVEVDIPEAKEFFATIRLSLDLGNSVRSGFNEQADRIQQLLRNSMQKRIEKRKVWATIVQAPILLLVMAVFALPLIATVGEIF